MTIKDIIEKTTQHFKQKGFATARLDAEVLFGFALKMKRVELYLHFEKPLSEEELEKCREVVRQRSAGEPVAYICGTRDFYKSTFIVGPGVLIPRPETELLVEKSVEWVQKNHPDKKIRILDLGAGSGCISLSLAKEFPLSKITAVEREDAAAAYFKKNKNALGIENAELVIADADQLSRDSFEHSFELIVSNPPYISNEDKNVEANVQKYEPAAALFSNEDGFLQIKLWVESALKLLKPGGACFFEIGSSQGPMTKGLFESKGLATKVYKDYSQKDRVVFATKTK